MEPYNKAEAGQQMTANRPPTQWKSLPMRQMRWWVELLITILCFIRKPEQRVESYKNTMIH